MCPAGNRNYRSELCFLLVWCSLAAGVASAQTPIHLRTLLPLALNDSDAVTVQNNEHSGLSDPSLTAWYKGIGTGVSVILAFFIAWYLVYPWVLRGGNVWPVSLFGYCTCAACLISWLIGLLIYWEDLRFPPPFDGPQSSGREWGIRAACLFAAAIMCVLSLVFWRSEAQSRTST